MAELDVWAHRGLVYWVYRTSFRWTYTKGLREDVLQAGFQGLLEASTRFSEEREVSFSVYARYWIHRRMLESVKTLAPMPEQGATDEVPAESPRHDPKLLDLRARLLYGLALATRAGLVSAKDVDLALARVGWFGGAPRSLTYLAQQESLSIGRIHQRCTKVYRALRTLSPQWSNGYAAQFQASPELVTHGS